MQPPQQTLSITVAVKMFINRISLVSTCQNLLLMLVVCIVAVVCSNAAGTRGGNRNSGQQEISSSIRGTALDKETREFGWTAAPLGERDLPILLALRDFCSRHPQDCRSDRTDWSTSPGLGRIFESRLYDSDKEDIQSRTANDLYKTTASTATNKQQQRRINEMLKARILQELLTTNQTTSLEDLNRLESSVFVKPSPVVEQTDGREASDQEEEEEEEKEKEKAAEETDDYQVTSITTEMPPSQEEDEQMMTRRMRPIKWTSNLNEGPMMRRGHELSTRAGHKSGTRVPPSTYRVTLAEAQRFIRAQQQQVNLPLSSSPLLTTNNLLSHQYNRPPLQQRGLLQAKPQDKQQQQQKERRNSERTSTIRHGPHSVRLLRSDNAAQQLLVPKRTDSSYSSATLQQSEQEPESGIRSLSSISTSTSDHQSPMDQAGALTNSPDNHEGAEQASSFGTDDDAMKCNMRRFTYKATKLDESGNQCTGLVTAAICYGGCDTGEIADWLFPHKKSIHKVCRHGGRIRRRALLGYCTSSSGSELKGHEVAASLREYHYVDARDCVCKRCTSVDTTCLGTMSRPHLQTMSEAAAEIDENQQQLTSNAGGD